MFKLCRLRCEYMKLHAPSSFRLDELLLTSNLQQGNLGGCQGTNLVVGLNHVILESVEIKMAALISFSFSIYKKQSQLCGGGAYKLPKVAKEHATYTTYQVPPQSKFIADQFPCMEVYITTVCMSSLMTMVKPVSFGAFLHLVASGNLVTWTDQDSSMMSLI